MLLLLPLLLILVMMMMAVIMMMMVVMIMVMMMMTMTMTMTMVITMTMTMTMSMMMMMMMKDGELSRGYFDRWRRCWCCRCGWIDRYAAYYEYAAAANTSSAAAAAAATADIMVSWNCRYGGVVNHHRSSVSGISRLGHPKMANVFPGKQLRGWISPCIDNKNSPYLDHMTCIWVGIYRYSDLTNSKQSLQTGGY